MIANTAAEGDAPEVSAYTRSMARCLDGLSDPHAETLSPADIHVLMNMVQGRMLEFLADEICRSHGVHDSQSKSYVVTALLGIFSDEFFALFRSKIQKRPELALLIARRIIRSEYGSHGGVPGSTDRLFPAIFRKYFEYRNLDSLLQMVESDAEIQKILLLALLKRQLPAKNPELYRQITRILDEDHEGLCPNLFMECVSEAGMDTLLERIRSGAWRTEMQGMREKLAILRGE